MFTFKLYGTCSGLFVNHCILSAPSDLSLAAITLNMLVNNSLQFSVVHTVVQNSNDVNGFSDADYETLCLTWPPDKMSFNFFFIYLFF